MGVTLDKHESRAGQSEALNQLRLEGDVGIGCAAEFKGLLEQALGCAVRILLEGATDLDVTAVQLLWAAGRKAKGSGVEYSIVSVAPEPILDALSEAGLQQFISPVNVL